MNAFLMSFYTDKDWSFLLPLLQTSNTVLTVFDLFPAKRKRSNQEFQVFLKTRIALSVKL